MNRICIWFICLQAGTINAQNPTSGALDKVPEFLFYRIKTLDHFFARFNNEDESLAKINSTDSVLQISRETMIASLFDITMLSDSTNYENGVRFIRLVDSLNTRLNYRNENWYAIVKCKAKLDGDEKVVSLTMRFAGDDSSGFRWLIVGVDSCFKESEPVKPEKIIPPTNHNVGFSELFRVINEEGETVESYLEVSKNQKNLLQFAELAKGGKIELVNVNSPTYHFLQIPGWSFTVDQFNRDSKNSGWLISSLIPLSEYESWLFKKEVLNISSID